MTIQLDDFKVEVPSDAEIATHISASRDIDERVAWVRSFARKADRSIEPLRNGVANLQKEKERLEVVNAQQANEINALRQKLADLPDSDRAAVDARQAMVRQMHAARSILDRWEADTKESTRRLREALKKPE